MHSRASKQLSVHENSYDPSPTIISRQKSEDKAEPAPFIIQLSGDLSLDNGGINVQPKSPLKNQRVAQKLNQSINMDSSAD